MKNSALRQGFYKINTNYYDYFVTDRHPIVAGIATFLFWFICAIAVVAFFSLLYYSHNITFFTIVGVLVLIEVTYQLVKK